MDNMVNTLCIVQARLTSTRLPNKVLMPLGNFGKSLLEHVYERLKMAKCIDEVVFAIPGNPENEPLAKYLREKDIPVHVEYGDENDVLMRFYNCAKEYKPRYIFRATCDNPFVDWKHAEQLYAHCNEYDYVSSDRTPLGVAVELFTMDALTDAYKHADKPMEREHVTPYLYRHPELFRVGDLPYYLDVPTYRLTVDTKEDYMLAQELYAALDKGVSFTNEQVYAFLQEHPELLKINAAIKQKSE